MGDGNDCTLDSDGDGYPDVPLASCDEDNEAIYCIKVRRMCDANVYPLIG